MRRWRERHPERILKAAVHGMLPKNRSRRLREERLVLLQGDVHPHGGQTKENPWKLSLAPSTAKSGSGGLPDVSGYFVELENLDQAVRITTEAHVPDSVHRANAEKSRKAALHKQLKAYLLGRGERPDFLPQKKD